MSGQEGEKKHQRRCDGIREDLKNCLLQSDCVRKLGFTPKTCMNMVGDPYYPEECQPFIDLLFQCKRSMVCIINIRPLQGESEEDGPAV